MKRALVILIVLGIFLSFLPYPVLKSKALK